MEKQTMGMRLAKAWSHGRKRIVLLAALVCCLALIGTGTLAFFTAEETAYNVITTATLEMELVEEDENGDPYPDEPITGIMPGQKVGKVVYVRNTGGVDFYVRIRLTQTAVSGSGSSLSMEGIRLDIDTENWTEQDGYYYYNAPVLPGEETTPLFNQVDFGVELDNEYMDATVTILVEAQTVQSRNNGTNALDAIGWPEVAE